MREIKFRVFNIKEKEMITHFNGARIDYALQYWETHKHVSAPMQYTGLKDKNGIEIYEGDIVDTTILSGDSRTMKIHFEFGSFRVGLQPLNVQEDIKVIGNIYENPELLEEK